MTTSDTPADRAGSLLVLLESLAQPAVAVLRSWEEMLDTPRELRAVDEDEGARQVVDEQRDAIGREAIRAARERVVRDVLEAAALAAGDGPLFDSARFPPVDDPVPLPRDLRREMYCALMYRAESRLLPTPRENRHAALSALLDHLAATAGRDPAVAESLCWLVGR